MGHRSTLRRLHAPLRITLPLLFALGCGSTNDASTVLEGPREDPSSGEGASGGPGGNPTPDPSLEGVWQVKGKDARGTYAGEVELAIDGNAFRFTRVVRYETAQVEGGRGLWWVWEGKASGTRAKLDVDVDLRRADFVKRRGTVERTAADAPIHVKGSFGGSVDLTGSFTGTSIDEKETWSAKKPRGATPIFALDRTVAPGHASPGPMEKSTLFGQFKDFHGLSVVAPYTSRPEFAAAIHGHVVDRTDFGFYRTHPNAIRVVDKVLDDVSLGETLLRANAFRHTLASKAALFQADIDAKFMDPAVGMIVDGGPPGGPFSPSGDSALWTGTYVAAQAYQYEVTGDAQTLARLKTSLNALLTLQEIVGATGNWSTFARTLRKSTGTTTTGWQAGTGAYAALDWMPGGNNDMMKGLLYGYLIGYRALCKTSVLDAGLCDRLKTNAKHLADDVKIERPNDLDTHWLTAVVRKDFAYQVKAEGYWAPFKIEIKNNPLLYSQGISDWSGNHLVFISKTIEVLLSQEIDLGGDAAQTIKNAIDDSHAKVEKQRLLVWHMIHAAHGTGAKSSAFIDDMKLRFAEIPYPKLGFEVDHRIASDFCLSPYPNVPWKGDWMQYPSTDRTQSLVHYPTFEMPVDVVYFKQHAAYAGPGAYETPGVDYLHTYWYARRAGLLNATD